MAAAREVADVLAGAPAGMTGFVLHTVCEDGGYLFLRLRRVTGR